MRFYVAMGHYGTNYQYAVMEANHGNPILIAVFPNGENAQEYADFLNQKYGG